MKNYLQSNIKTLACLNDKSVSSILHEVGVSDSYLGSTKNVSFAKVDLFADYFAINPEDLLFKDFAHECLEYIFEKYVQFKEIKLGDKHE